MWTQSGEDPCLGGNEAIARCFWSRAGTAEAFPRNMVRATPLALPLALVHLPRLMTDTVTTWLERRGASSPALPPRIPLKGLLVAARNTGILFLDSDQSEDELRFSIAHEAAHFLLHHCLPRLRAVRVLGTSIEPVLDGERPPTTQERLSAVLASVPLGAYTHLNVAPSGEAPSSVEARVEIEADLLAFELLAPKASLRPLPGTPAATAETLATRFGLPTWAANAYSDLLCAWAKPRPSVRDWFVTP